MLEGKGAGEVIGNRCINRSSHRLVTSPVFNSIMMKQECVANAGRERISEAETARTNDQMNVITEKS